MDAFLADIGYTRWAIAVLLWIPVAGAAAVLLFPAARAKKIALAVTLLEFLVSLGLWWAYVPDGAAVQLVARHRWVPDWGIQYYVGMDGISLMLVLLTTFTMPLAVLGSWAGITTKEKGFYALMLVLTTGMIGVFVSLDLFLFYVFWEVMLVPMYFIIGVWGGKGRLYASLKFFIYTMLGSLLMLVAILVLFYSAGRATGVFSFQYEHILRYATVPGSAGFWLFGAFFLAFAIKVPMVPFH
ncbi:MAG: Fe-S-binding domain-containing protein, partial [Gemmatimonadales bacterium]